MTRYIWLALTLIGFASGFFVQDWRYASKIADLKLEYSDATIKAISKALEDSNKLQKVKDEALVKAQKQSKINAKAAASAASERDSLLKQLAQSSSTISQATCTSTRDYASTVTAVLGECIAGYTEMAEKAQGHALDARTLRQAWPVLEESP